MKETFSQFSLFYGHALLFTTNSLLIPPIHLLYKQLGSVQQYPSTNRRVTRGEEGGGDLPCPFSKFKEKCPDFGKKCPY